MVPGKILFQFFNNIFLPFSVQKVSGVHHFLGVLQLEVVQIEVPYQSEEKMCCIICMLNKHPNCFKQLFTQNTLFWLSHW